MGRRGLRIPGPRRPHRFLAEKNQRSPWRDSSHRVWDGISAEFMKKKLIITSILSVFLSLLVLLSVSVVLVDISGKRSAEKSLSNYLAIAETYYEPNSSVYTPEKTKELLAGNSSVRLTIISPEGTVKIDTFGDPTENHLDRPEIQNLGTIYYRKSATLGYQMIYLAGKDTSSDGSSFDYVRVALPVG